ncbi:MAG: type II toxin-antitoxin system PemK/MazF family toxin [Deltaproteobacteria bacterium]|nr:type II toxin-antitoxin system PemK/MazF family toxin [Deltaproteobacteria bacterium]MBI4374696.1 type II toxin-antitoxin system PemK/MazF family toxin [Deltaproteobacteria bacterium]
MTFETFDVVTVPFPFADSDQSKRRPALILSQGEFQTKIGHSVMAMITSAKNPPWPLDVRIRNGSKTGLSADSVVRMKLFTLDLRFVVRKIGRLSKEDRQAVLASLGRAIVH